MRPESYVEQATDPIGARWTQNEATTTVDDILITEELTRRPMRAPNYAAENRALIALAECMTQNPQHLTQMLTDLAVELCNAGSAGISLLQEEAGEEFFAWIAMSGVYTPYVGERTPRHFSPCGTTLERGAPQLFYGPARLFVYLDAVDTPIVEGLVVPFELNHKPAGTIWIVGHHEEQHFDGEDVRIMTSLARFTSAALQMNQLLEARTKANDALQRKVIEHEQARDALQKSESALHQLNGSLEQLVAERTNELQRINQELDQFAYVASHDLKAPLRAIHQLATWLDEDAAEFLPQESRVHLMKLQGRVKRMENLLEDILTYSRAGRHRYPPERVKVGELIANVVDILAPPPTFTIHTACQTTLITERIPLEIVLRSLVENAIKHHHNPTAGHVEIRCEEQSDHVEFVVTDNGPGIDPAYHERIFEIFHTLRPRDEVEGSGIGLSIAKKIVEGRGGKIRVESSAENGATFYFTWPLSLPD